MLSSTHTEQNALTNTFYLSKGRNVYVSSYSCLLFLNMWAPALWMFGLSKHPALLDDQLCVSWGGGYSFVSHVYKKKHGFPNLVSNHRQEKEHIILCGVAERTHTHQWNVNYIICINRHIRAHIAGKNRREYITHSCLFVLWVFFFYSCQVDATCGVALNLCRIKHVCLAGVIWKQGIALLGHLTFAAFQSEHSFSIY